MGAGSHGTREGGRVRISDFSWGGEGLKSQNFRVSLHFHLQVRLFFWDGEGVLTSESSMGTPPLPPSSLPTCAHPAPMVTPHRRGGARSDDINEGSRGREMGRR